MICMACRVSIICVICVVVFYVVARFYGEGYAYVPRNHLELVQKCVVKNTDSTTTLRVMSSLSLELALVRSKYESREAA